MNMEKYILLGYNWRYIFVCQERKSLQILLVEFLLLYLLNHRKKDFTKINFT